MPTVSVATVGHQRGRGHVREHAGGAHRHAQRTLVHLGAGRVRHRRRHGEGRRRGLRRDDRNPDVPGRGRQRTHHRSDQWRHQARGHRDVPGQAVEAGRRDARQREGEGRDRERRASCRRRQARDGQPGQERGVQGEARAAVLRGPDAECTNGQRHREGTVGLHRDQHRDHVPRRIEGSDQGHGGHRAERRARNPRRRFRSRPARRSRPSAPAPRRSGPAGRQPPRLRPTAPRARVARR